jgi:biopolymer transport protein ExbD
VALPQASNAPVDQKPNALQVGIDADGFVRVNDAAVALTELEARLRDAVAADAQAELHLLAGGAVRYATVAEVMSAARRAGVRKIGFVTQPAAEH